MRLSTEEALGKLWDKVETSGPDVASTLWGEVLLAKYDAGLAAYERQSADSPQHDEETMVVPGDERLDHELFWRHVAENHVDPKLSEPQLNALARLLTNRALRSMKSWLAGPGCPLDLLPGPPIQPRKVGEQASIVFAMGAWARCNGAPIASTDSADRHVPALETLQYVLFNFLNDNTSPNERTDLLRVLVPLGLCCKAVLLRNDRYALRFLISAHMKKSAIGRVGQKVAGTTDTYVIPYTIPGESRPVSLRVRPLARDGLKAVSGQCLEREVLYGFAQNMLSPGMFDVFRSTFGAEIDAYWDRGSNKYTNPTSAQVTRPSFFSKYFMWIMRSGQEHCAKCLDPFLYQGQSGPEVADSDSDHICVDDKPGSGSPAKLAEKDPFGNPGVVEEMFALRAVHRRATCHAVPGK